MIIGVMRQQKLKDFLNKKVEQYNRISFIETDPILIPHLFTLKQDIEISGLFAASFAWGNRKTILNKSRELMNRMDMAPYDFVMHHKPSDLKRIIGFKHRTFIDTDVLYFIEFLHQHYKEYVSLESAFTEQLNKKDIHIEAALNHFKKYFFSYEHLNRTKKHVSSPLQKSACKRLNMFLRWMVRIDNNGIDFGLWKTIKPSQLICPIDVHVARVAQQLRLLKRKQIDWNAAVELTRYFATLDQQDPVKYDFALFGLGVMESKSHINF